MFGIPESVAFIQFSEVGMAPNLEPFSDVTLIPDPEGQACWVSDDEFAIK